MSASRRAPVVAAGAIIWRERKGKLEVLVIHRPRYDDWSWPKGKLDAGETPPVAAVREVAEETGLHVTLGVPLPMLRYPNGNGRRKEVYYWAATVLPDDSPARAARPDVPRSVNEVDDMRWLSVEKAAKALTRKSDRTPLKALVKLHESRELRSRAVVVVRHASAHSRSSWPGAEADRPLTPSGVAQAEALIPTLAAFGVAAIVTSPWERCGATMAPYAKASGVALEVAEVLTEDGHRDTPGRTRELARALYAAMGTIERARPTFAPGSDDASGATDTPGAADARATPESRVVTLTATAAGSGSVAVCTHRPVLPAVLEPLDAIAPGWVRRSRPSKDPYLRPASIAVAHVGQADDGARVVSFEVHSAHGTTT